MPLTTDGPDWRNGFLFVGDQLAVDFVNTHLVADEAPVEFLPDWPALVRWFGAAGLLGNRGARRLQAEWADRPETAGTFHGLIAFREHLRAAIARIAAHGAPPKSFTEEVNRLLAAHPIPIQLRVSGGRLRKETAFEPRHPDDLIGPLTEAVATLLVDADPRRVRQCEGCVAYFYDRSKNGARRWCSMRLCGNRAKVARYARRHRGDRR